MVFANSSDLSQGMLMERFWKYAAPFGHCKLSQLDIQITPQSGAISCKRSQLEMQISPPSSPLEKNDEEIDREEFLALLFQKRPGSPSLLNCALKARASALFASVLGMPPRQVEAAWPEGRRPSMEITCLDDELLWQEIMVKFCASAMPAAHDAQHFLDVIKAGMDPNNVPFPRMQPPKPRGMVPPRPASGRRVTVQLQDARPFPIPCEIPDLLLWATDSEKEVGEKWTQGNARKAYLFLWTTDAEKEAGEKWTQSLARKPEELRHAFYDGQPMNMDLTPWPVLPNGVVANDECSSAQLQVWEHRAKQGPLSAKQVEKRRAELLHRFGERWVKKVNSRCFEEVRPELECEASFLEMRARWARDKALEARMHDEQAEQGAAFVAWPIENERRWPALPAAWTRHTAWFKMWRKRRPMAPGLIPSLKRSDSICSNSSWLSVSDISWVEVESRAEEQGWQVVLDEASPALKEAEEGLGNLCKADIGEMRSMASPPGSVVLTMEVLCVLLGVPVPLKNGSADYWLAGKALLAEPNLLEKLIALQSCLNTERLEAVTPYIARDDFTPEVVGKGSKAAEGLCKWIRELYKYHVMGHAAAEVSWREVAQRLDSEILAEAERLLNTIEKRDVQELKSLGKPPCGVDMVCICVLHLLAGINPNIELTAKRNLKDCSWKGCQKLLGNVEKFVQDARELPDAIKAGKVPRKNVEKARKIKDSMGIAFSVDSMMKKSKAAATICAWVMQIIAFYDKAAPPAAAKCATAPKDCPKSEDDFLVTKAAISELKSLGKPPAEVCEVVAAVAFLLGREEHLDWRQCQQMLANPTAFVEQLRALDTSKVSQVSWEQAKEITERPSFIQSIRIERSYARSLRPGERSLSQYRPAVDLACWVLQIMEQRSASP